MHCGIADKSRAGVDLAAMGERIGLVQAVKLALGQATLGNLWEALAEAYGSRLAFTLEDPLRLRVLTTRELSFEDLREVIARLAGGFQELGLRKGDRVAVCTESRIDYALTLFAAIRAGGVAVPLHHHLKPKEALALAAQARARYLVADPALAAETGDDKRVLVAGPEGDLDRAAAAASPSRRSPSIRRTR